MTNDSTKDAAAKSANDAMKPAAQTTEQGKKPEADKAETSAPAAAAGGKR